MVFTQVASGGAAANARQRRFTRARYTAKIIQKMIYTTLIHKKLTISNAMTRVPTSTVIAASPSPMRTNRVSIAVFAC
jgi:hypothetical protein